MCKEHKRNSHVMICVACVLIHTMCVSFFGYERRERVCDRERKSVRVCVCVREWERERERETGRFKMDGWVMPLTTLDTTPPSFFLCGSICLGWLAAFL